MYQAINEGLALALENDPRTGEYNLIYLFKKGRMNDNEQHLATNAIKLFFLRA